MRQIADVGLEKSHPARRVDRLEHEERAAAKLLMRGLQKSHQIGRLEMLDHLHGHHTAETRIRLTLEERDGVDLRHVEAARAAYLDHRAVGVDAAGSHTALPKEIEQLAATASNVEHVGRAAEDLGVVGD